ncbi:MAG: hypothetical protein AB7N76_00055 [Planctomycetota bacterium]
MLVVTVMMRDLAPGRVDQVRLALVRFFEDRLLWSPRRGSSVLAIGQHLGDDDYSDPGELRARVVEVVLRANCGPCLGSVMSYRVTGAGTTFVEGARELGLDVGRMSAVDQLGGAQSGKRVAALQTKRA